MLSGAGVNMKLATLFSSLGKKVIKKMYHIHSIASALLLIITT